MWHCSSVSRNQTLVYSFYFDDYTPEFNSMINRMYVNLIFILFALSNLVLISYSNENRSCVILLSSYRIGIEVQDELMAVMISHIACMGVESP